MITPMLEQLDYDNGYQQALEDLCRWFCANRIALKYARIYSQKNMEKLLEVISRRADIFQLYGEKTPIYFEMDGKKVKKVEVKVIK